MRPLPDLIPAEARPFDVAGLGLNSIDLLALVDGFPVRGTKHRVHRLVRRPGGQTATAMVTCARLGWRARYVGSFGGDEHGRLSKTSLRDAGVDVSACRTVSGATNQFAVILVERERGDRTILWDRHPGLRMGPRDVPVDAVTSGRILLVDCHETEAATEAARVARAAQVRTVIDVERVRPGIDVLLKQVDVIIAAESFPIELTGQSELGSALRMMAEQFDASLLVTTLGADGSVALAGSREIRTPGVRVDVVDTTGAGDAFRGGFIAGWLAAGRDADASEILRYANAVAALNCRALGAREGIPNRAEVAHVLAGVDE